MIKTLYNAFLKAGVVSTDSRNIPKGCLFFALKGDRFDGNQFAAQAIADGASLAIVSDPKIAKGEAFVLVEDTLKTLQALATYHRDQFDIPLLGITGTNGKTTTKELIATVLSTHYNTFATKGNFNNHIGVPLSLLQITKETEIAVIEMGANHPKEIEALCKIAKPTLGMITNVGKAHLEGFGGFEGVKKTKAEMYTYLKENNGLVFRNKKEPFLKEMLGEYERVLTYDENLGSVGNPLSFHLKQSVPHLIFSVKNKTKSMSVDCPLYGEYNFANLLSAGAVGHYFNVPLEKMLDAFRTFIPKNNRSQLQKEGTNMFYLDAYNANPTSMKNALKSFYELKEKHKIVILGDMLELGEQSTQEHVQIVDLVQSYSKGEFGFEKAFFVGKAFKNISNDPLAFFENIDDLKKQYPQDSFQNAHVLLKGSRGIRLEQLLAK